MMLHTKYQDSRPCGFRQEAFFMFFLYKPGYVKHVTHGAGSFLICLFVCCVALHPKSTAMVIAGRSAHLKTLFPGKA